MNVSKAFTFKYNGLSNSLKTECRISEAFKPSPGAVHPPISTYIGLWDTGASASVISQNVIDQLGLQPVGTAKVFHANGESTVDTYIINMLLPNSVAYHSIKVTKGILTGFDVLIGMDIIVRGDFSITNLDGKTCFSFRAPSVKEIDYVKEGPKVKKVDPYALCPCASGKKYKFCHGLNNKKATYSVAFLLSFFLSAFKKEALTTSSKLPLIASFASYFSCRFFGSFFSFAISQVTK